jgi:hypothetical protein
MQQPNSVGTDAAPATLMFNSNPLKFFCQVHNLAAHVTVAAVAAEGAAGEVALLVLLICPTLYSRRSDTTSSVSRSSDSRNRTRSVCHLTQPRRGAVGSPCVVVSLWLTFLLSSDKSTLSPKRVVTDRD